MEYIIKVWLSTILFGSLLLCVILWANDPSTSNEFMDLIGVLFLCILFSAVFSIPTIIFQSLANLSFKKMGMSAKAIKVILSLIAILGTFISFYIVKVSFAPNLGPSVYSAIMVASIWYFKISEK